MIELSSEQILNIQKIYGEILKSWYEKEVGKPLIQLIEPYPYPNRSVISFSHEIRLGDNIRLRRHGKTDHELFSLIAWQEDYVIKIALDVWVRTIMLWDQFAKEYGFRLFEQGAPNISMITDIESAVQRMMEERPDETIAGLI